MTPVTRCETKLKLHCDFMDVCMMISVLVSVMLNPRGEDIFSAHSVETKPRYTDAL